MITQIQYLPGSSREKVVSEMDMFKGEPMTAREKDIMISTADMVHAMYRNREAKEGFYKRLRKAWHYF